MNRILAISVLGIFLAAGGTGWADDHGHGSKGKGQSQAKDDYKHGKKELKQVEKNEKHARPVTRDKASGWKRRGSGPRLGGTSRFARIAAGWTGEFS